MLYAGRSAKGFHPSGEVKSAPQMHFSVVAVICSVQFGHHAGGPSAGFHSGVAAAAFSAAAVRSYCDGSKFGLKESARLGPSRRRSDTTRVLDHRSCQPTPVSPRKEN